MAVSVRLQVCQPQLGIMEPKHVCHSSRFIFLLPMYRPRHKKQFKADVQPVGVKTQTTQKLREHQKEREALCAQLQTLEKRDLRLLSLANPDLDRRLTCVVVASEQAASSLKPLHMRVHLWQNTVQQFQELLRMCVVWFCDTDDLESAVMSGAHEDVSAFVMSTRLVGGYVAGQEWLRLCVANKRLLRPVAKLRPAVHNSNEVCFHKSLEPSPPDCAASIARCLEALTLVGRSGGWRLRTRWQDVRNEAGMIFVSNKYNCKQKLQDLSRKAADEGKVGSARTAWQLLQAISYWEQ